MIDAGLLLPTISTESPPHTRAFDATIDAAEQHGFDSLWVLERLFHQTPILDSFTALTWAAARTQRVKLGSAVFLALLRNPALFARQVATLDTLSAGRVELGLSLGGSESELASIGVKMSQRASRFDEALTIIKRLLTEDHVTYNGRYYQVIDATIEPKPHANRHLPLWIGATSKAGMQRTARVADGWIPDGYFSGICRTAEDFARLRGEMLNMLAEAGRDSNAFRFGKLFYWVSTGGDAALAEAEVDATVQAYYGRKLEGAQYLSGNPESITRQIAAFIREGLDTVIIGPAKPDPEQVRLIATEILPGLRATASAPQRS